MDSNVIVSIVTGIFTLTGVIIASISQGNRIQNKLEIAMAVMNEKIESLSETVKQLNATTVKIPVLESRLETLEKEIEELKKNAQKSS